MYRITTGTRKVLGTARSRDEAIQLARRTHALIKRYVQAEQPDGQMIVWFPGELRPTLPRARRSTPFVN